jgi:tetratricopeptide (TPR) repeat protein
MNPRAWVGSIERLPVEIQLSNSATWEMTKNALSNEPIFGYGPGTTGIAFGQIKPETLNQSIVWNLNFDRASSELANIAIETGLLGVLAFEATSILFLLYALYFLLKQGDRPGRMQAFGLFMVWLGLYISHFFYFFDTTMYFMFWVTLALFVAITHWEDQRAADQVMSFNDSPRSALSWMFASLLMLAVLLVGGFFQTAVYFGDVAYASGLRELRQQEPNLERAASFFRAAIQRNQYRDVYYLAYGQNLVFMAASEINKENGDAAKFQNYIVETISAGNSATSISPNKASNWASRGQFYSQIRSLSVPGADDLIIASAEEAVKKDENSPVLWLQLGQAYSNGAETIDPTIVAGGQDTDGDGLSDEFEQTLTSNPQNSESNGNGVSDGDEVRAGFNPSNNTRLTAQQLQLFTKIDQDKLRKAEEALKKSISLKNNLPNAYISLARVYERWDKTNEARGILEEGIKVMPNNVDMKYELGRIVFNQGDLAKAEGYFKDVVRLVPDHANSHYSLGLLALQRNDRARALEQFKKTQEIISASNQTNADLERIIKELEANSNAEAGQ